MTVAQALAAYLLAAGILTLTPGADTALVLRTATASGPRPAAFAAAGIGLGCLAWGVIVSLGLGAVLATSEVAFTALKWAGALYLLWLGVTLVWRPRTVLDAGGAAPSADRDALAALRRGFLSNLLNPKVGVFYITFLPQFVPPGVAVAPFSLLLAVIHVVMGALWCAVLIAATLPLARVLSRPAVVAGMDRVAGSIFIAFGLRLALSRQP